MQFHDFISQIHIGYLESKKQYEADGTPWTLTVQDCLEYMLCDCDTNPADLGTDEHAFKKYMIEKMWRSIGRPYYNVWPVAVDLCQKTKLNVTLEELPVTCSPLLVRFPAGHEPFGIEWILFHSQEPIDIDPELDGIESKSVSESNEISRILAAREAMDCSLYTCTETESGELQKKQVSVFPESRILENLARQADLPQLKSPVGLSGYGLGISRSIGQCRLHAVFKSTGSDHLGEILNIGNSNQKNKTVEEIFALPEGDEGCFGHSVGNPDHNASDLECKQNHFILKTYAFISLLSQGHDLITPAILEADKERYESTDEDQVRTYLQEKASKSREQRIYDVGRDLQIEYDEAKKRNGGVAPHTRCRHLQIYHTGKGRKIPKLIWAKEALVNRAAKDFTNVPTDFMGDETKEELEVLEYQPKKKKAKRDNIPARLKFTVRHRDKLRCRYCGISVNHDEDVVFHCDHIVSVHDGGKTVLENLVNACNVCNLGKGARSLTEGERRELLQENKQTKRKGKAS